MLEEGEAERQSTEQHMSEALAEKEQQVAALTHELQALAAADSDASDEEEGEDDIEDAVTASTASTAAAAARSGVSRAKGLSSKTATRSKSCRGKNRAVAAEVEVGAF